MQAFAVRILILLLVSGCAKPWPERHPLEVAPLSVSQGEWRVTDHVIVITDASATMTLEATLPEARALAQSFVAALPEPTVASRSGGPYRAGLIGFGGSERLTSPLVELDRSALAQVAADLRPLGGPGPAGGTTPLQAVLGEVQNSLKGSQGQTAIVIFSDGMPDSEAETLEAARALISSHSGEVCIHTVHSGTDAAGQSFLARLAALTSCGSARSGASLNSARDLTSFERAVFMAARPASLPPVAAIRPDPCSQAVVLRGVHFSFDRAEITAESRPALDTAVTQLRECPAVSVRVDGHTCSLGPEDYNRGLSERRAAAVRAYLISAGVAGERLEVVGHGESSPVAPNDHAQGREQNRRVELTPQL